MIPTIDFSLIGVLLAIWSVVKVIWGYLSGALNWITQRALAAIIGSKFWATAAFLACALVVLNLFSWLLNIALGQLASLAFSGFSSLPSGVSDLLGLVVPGSEVVSLLAAILSSFAVYALVVHAGFARAHLVKWFDILSKSWKT